MLEEGIFDIHCHIVPGVDDGAADIEETRKLLEMEYKQGVRNIILTPHFRFQMFETPLEKVQRQFRLAEEAAADISKDLHLYLGCEFHANMEMLPMLREKKVATMAGSRYVLVEFSHNSEESLLKMDEDSYICYDSEAFYREFDPSRIKTPIFTGTGFETPRSDAIDYEAEIQTYVKMPIDKSQYQCTVKSIRPNEIMWLGQVLMLKATEEKVILQYTIISENTNGDLTGEIEVNN